MKIVTSKQVLPILMLILTTSFVWAQNRSGVRVSNAQLIGNVTGTKVQGCGCYFQFPNESQNSERYVFFEDFSETSPLMNLDGQNIRLRLVSSTEPSSGVRRKGQRFSCSYVSGKVKVRMNFEVTSVCAPNDEQCESTGYDVTFTVIKGSRKQIVKAVGGCGC